MVEQVLPVLSAYSLVEIHIVKEPPKMTIINLNSLIIRPYGTPGISGTRPQKTRDKEGKIRGNYRTN
jgi:hypothetical protein